MTGIHRNDSVALALHVLGDAVAGAHGIIRQTDDGDRSVFPEDLSSCRPSEPLPFSEPGGTVRLHDRSDSAISGFQSGEFQEADLHSSEFFHEHPEALEHQADLVLPALDQLHFVPRVVADDSAV